MLTLPRGRKVGPAIFDRRHRRLTQGMVGYWSPVLTGPTGLQLLDLSGENNVGTLTNMDAATDWVSDRHGSVLDFDGSNDRVQLSRTVSLSTTSFTISLWAQQNAGGIGMPIGDRTLTTSYVWLRTGNYVRFSTPSGLVEFTGVTTFTNWNHLVLTGESISTSLSSITLFWNGIRQAPISVVNGTFTLNTIGDGYTSQAFPFPGRIAEVVAWARPMTEGGAASLFSMRPGFLGRLSRANFFLYETAIAYSLEASTASYSLTGQAIPLLCGRALPADTGSLLLSGQSTPLLTSRLLNADQGSYAYSGTDAATLLGRLLDAGAVVYTLDGTAAGFLASRRISADTVAYLASGLDVGFLRTRVLEAGTGQYVLVASPVNITPGTGGAAPYYYLFLLGGSR